MADYPSNLKYSKDHEWARVEGNNVTVGITAHAQDQLGDVVYLELPAVGTTVEKGKPFGVVESTKAVSELFAPVSGKIVKINQELVSAPEGVNTDPHGKAWMVEIQMSNAADLNELLSAEQYQKHLAEGH